MLLSRVLDVFLRRRREKELSEEIKAHIELLTEEHMRRGMSRKDGYAAARRAFGGIDQVKETYRDQRGLPFFDACTRELYYAARSLRATPIFTMASIVILALGIGATSAVFSVVNGLLLQPLPVRDPDRLVRIWKNDVQRGFEHTPLGYPEYDYWEERASSFVSIAAPMPGDSVIKAPSAFQR